jgi:hypothetical protein
MQFIVNAFKLFLTLFVPPLLQVLTKWGEYSSDVQFILQRSPLDANKDASQRRAAAPPAAAAALHPGGAIWKTPPPGSGGGGSNKPLFPNKTDAARLSPDSGNNSFTSSFIVFKRKKMSVSLLGFVFNCALYYFKCLCVGRHAERVC